MLRQLLPSLKVGVAQAHCLSTQASKDEVEGIICGEESLCTGLWLPHLSTSCQHLLFFGLLHDPSNSPDGAVLHLPLGPKHRVFPFTSSSAVSIQFYPQKMPLASVCEPCAQWNSHTLYA